MWPSRWWPHPERRGRRLVAHVTGEIIINRPVAEVFDLVADQHNEPCYNSRLRNVDQVTPDPVGPGTQFGAQISIGGRHAPMLITFTAYDRPRRLGSLTSMAAMDIAGELTFVPVPEGTLLRWAWELRAHGMLKLVIPLVTQLARRQKWRIWTSLKRYLEAQPAHTPSP